MFGGGDTDKWSKRHAQDRQTEKQINKKVNSQTNRQTPMDGRIDKKRQTDRQADIWGGLVPSDNVGYRSSCPKSHF